jgi:cytochrome c oxidase subunit 2
MNKLFPLFPESASELARDVDRIYFAYLGIATFFSLLIAGLVIYFVVRYRRRSEDETGKREKAGIWLEITWSVIPLVILMTMFVWGTSIFFRARRPPSDAIEYWATAKQWMWKFQHPEGIREINELHVPVGQPIKLTMTSEDVIHSFYVPAFRSKMDVLPGRYTTFWFEADTAGTYHLFCNEYCGAEHSLMIGKVIAMEPADYEAWLGGESVDASLVPSGEEIFAAQACNTCHKPDSAALGPILNGIFGHDQALEGGTSVVVDENYLRESILNPQAKIAKGYQGVMPTYQGKLSEEELVELILYIKSLSGDDSGGGEAETAATEPAAGEESS